MISQCIDFMKFGLLRQYELIRAERKHKPNEKGKVRTDECKSGHAANTAINDIGI